MVKTGYIEQNGEIYVNSDDLIKIIDTMLEVDYDPGLTVLKTKLQSIRIEALESTVKRLRQG